MESSLYHHGIKGMRWGIRRYQNPDGSLTNAGKKRYSNEGSHDTQVDVQNEKDRSRFHLTDGQKRALKIGVGVDGAMLVTYGAYKLGTATDLDKSLFLDKSTGLVKNPFPHTMKDDLLAVNPNGHPLQTNNKYFTNCHGCSAAYELRRKGFLVTAMPNDPAFQSQINKYFVNAEHKTVRLKNVCGVEVPNISRLNMAAYQKELERATQKAILKDPNGFRAAQKSAANALVQTLESFGPGARGNFSMNLANGGHNVAFEIGKDGKVLFMDSQVPRLMKTGDGVDGSYFKNIISQNNPLCPISVIRTDNKDPNVDFLIKNKIIQYDGSLDRGVGLAAISAGALSATYALKSLEKGAEHDNSKSNNVNSKRESKSNSGGF